MTQPNKVLLLEEFENLEGGFGDQLSVENIANMHGVSPEHIEAQLSHGIEVEMEHTNDAKTAEEIAKDHLVEDPNYYTKLDSIEGENTGSIMTFEEFNSKGAQRFEPEVPTEPTSPDELGEPGQPGIRPDEDPEPDDDNLTIDDLGDFDLPDSERLPLEEPDEAPVGNHVATFEQFKNI